MEEGGGGGGESSEAGVCGCVGVRREGEVVERALRQVCVGVWVWVLGESSEAGVCGWVWVLGESSEAGVWVCGCEEGGGGGGESSEAGVCGCVGVRREL